MKTFLIALTAAAALGAAPALAQDHAEHHATAATTTATAPKAMDMANMTPEELHKHCSMMMGGKMAGKPKHDHAADKLGHAPATTPPTEAEMKAMHEKCAAVMSEQKTDAPPKP
jgi:hypothetical protein